MSWNPNQHPRNPDGTFRSTGISRGSQRRIPFHVRRADARIRGINEYIAETGDVGTRAEQRREAQKVARLQAVIDRFNARSR